jgi:3alpha(or 20beta)-hydroxysteroid dehydrogenase
MSMGATVGRLEGKRAVITGAASGIGEETTRLFIREGASVVLADVDDERGRRIAGECGDRARFVHADVAEDGAEDGAAEAAVSVSVDEFGGLDVLFNNAVIPGRSAASWRSIWPCSIGPWPSI